MELDVTMRTARVADGARQKRAGVTQHVTFRASAVLQRRLDQLAAARGLNRSRAIQAAIMGSDDAERIEGALRREVLELLGEMARAVTVATMKELRKYHRERATRPADVPRLP
jgi:predicted transcriptional regulator